VPLVLPWSHVHADFADDGLGDDDVDAVDPREVDAADPLELAAEVELRGMALRLFVPLGPACRGVRRSRRCRCGRRARGGGGKLGREALEMRLQLAVAFGEPQQVGVIHVDLHRYPKPAFSIICFKGPSPRTV